MKTDKTQREHRGIFIPRHSHILRIFPVHLKIKWKNILISKWIFKKLNTILYISHKKWNTQQNDDYWMNGNPRDFLSIRRDYKVANEIFILWEERLSSIKKNQSKSSEREPSGSRSNLFLIIESLDCRFASNSCPEGSFDASQIFFCDTHTKNSMEMAFEYHLIFLRLSFSFWYMQTPVRKGI